MLMFEVYFSFKKQTKKQNEKLFSGLHAELRSWKQIPHSTG